MLGEGDDSGLMLERLSLLALQFGSAPTAGRCPWGKCPKNIDDLLRIAMERRASDLHLKLGNYPHLRMMANSRRSPDQPGSGRDMLTMAFSMMSARQKQKFKEPRKSTGLRGRRSGPLPCQRLPAARQRGPGASRHSDQDSRTRRTLLPKWSNRFAICRAAWCGDRRQRFR